MDRRTPQHKDLMSFALADRGPFVIPAGIMSEISYFIESRLGQPSLAKFLADIEDGSYTLDCGERDIPRVRELVLRYHDLPLGYADASVIACAERHGGTVLTLDHRHFSAVAREGTIQIVP
jgi:uncharacterized protein